MDNKQELLSPEEIDSTREAVDWWGERDDLMKASAEAQVAKLKDMGYVRFDREKVAKMLAIVQGHIAGNTEYKLADQLKEILNENK